MGEGSTIHAYGGLPGPPELPGEARADAARQIAAAALGLPPAVQVLRTRLGHTTSGAVWVIQVAARVNGRRVRVQETAEHLGDGLGRLVGRLHRHAASPAGIWTPRPWPQPGRLPVAPASDLPPDRVRRIVRVKNPPLVRCSPDDAVRTMDAMDYDIHLFTDPATGTDAVVHRIGPTGYRLARTVAAAPPAHSTAPLTLSPHSAPRLTDEQAVARLESGELPFLFYATPETGRGRVLYRRFDGHLGLIAGAEDPRP